MTIITDSNVRGAASAASPKVGTATRTGCFPSGKLPAVHVRAVEPLPWSTAATPVHGYPPTVTVGAGRPLGGLSMVSVMVTPA